MPLGLHAKLKEKLVGTLAELLPTLEIVRGIALTSESQRLLQALDGSLPSHGDIAEKLHRWISDQPLSDFLGATINTALMGDKYEDGSHAPITGLPGWSNVGTKANELIEQFDNLPEAYIVTVSAPEGMEKYLEANDGELRLSKTVRVAIASEKFSAMHPVSTGEEQRDHNVWDHTLLGGLIGSGDRNYEWKGAYLQIIKQGFIGRYIETATEHELIGDFKALWGVQLALGIAQRRRSWSAYPSKRKLIVHRAAGKNLELILRIELDAPASQLVDDIKFNDWMPGDHSVETKLGVYKLDLDKLDLVFGSSPEAERLRLAARWLFDSYATENELLAYVQAMVCLEIILGDASLIGEIGLGELLRNRCAYLIGKTSVQRGEILKDFREIYDVRSHIVHRGKNRMSAREREHYGKLIWYCKRCIHEELKLLEQAKKDEQRAAT
jgi:hypothetical protein